MSSHDCRIEGCLPLRDGVSEKELIQAVQPYLDAQSLGFNTEKEAGNIEVKDGCFAFSIDVSGRSGYRDDQLIELAYRLNRLVRSGSYFRLKDYDSGDLDNAIVPYFVGSSDDDLEQARLIYGTDLMREWVEPVLGERFVSALCNLIISMRGGNHEPCH